jgi:hypothetical protein
MGGRLLLRLNINGKPIAYQYCAGQMKRTLKRGSNRLEIVEKEAYEEY